MSDGFRGFPQLFYRVQSGSETHPALYLISITNTLLRDKAVGIANTWNHTAAASYVFMVLCLTKRWDNFIRVFLHMLNDQP
jgi:hypothetical protein